MKSPLLLSCLFAGLAFLSPLSAQVSIEKVIPSEEAGVVENASVRLNFPGGYLDYFAKWGADGSEKLAEERFGLSFCRPPRTNGGWDLWRFLRVWVKPANGEAAYEVMERKMLGSAEILEDGAQRVFEFRWPLDEGTLAVRLIQSPAQEEWMLVRVKLEGDAGSIQRVMLSAYPGNTAGPDERERWIAAGDQEFQVSTTAREMGSPDTGLVLFNRMAQEDTGCLVVVEPEGITRLSVTGGYNITLNYEVDPGTVQFTAALSGYFEQSSEEVVRVFAMEGARNMLQTLRNAKWEPTLDEARNQRLFGELEGLVNDVGTQEEANGFQSLQQQYGAAKEAGDIPGVRASLGNARELTATLVTRALAEWK